MEAQKQILIVIFLCIHIVRSTRTRLTRNIQCRVALGYTFISVSYIFRQKRNHFHIISTKSLSWQINSNENNIPISSTHRFSSRQFRFRWYRPVDGTLALDQIYIQIQMHYMYRLLWPISHLIRSLECFRNVPSLTLL